jgi:selenium metabolism protein YedF
MKSAIDCRGLSCPEPVLQVKAALEALTEGVLSVLVDNPASRENVKRFAESQGCAVQVAEEGTGWRLDVAKGYACDVRAGEPATAPGKPLPTALLISSDRLGPEPELGKILMRAFLNTLGQATTPPARVLFLNQGVHLTTAGSEALDVLTELEGSGVGLYSCGTCLEFFGKRDALRVGKVSNMYDTVETLTGPYKIVSIS